MESELKATTSKAKEIPLQCCRVEPCATTISLAGQLHFCAGKIHGKNTLKDKESKNNKNKNNVERLSQEQKSEVLAAVPRTHPSLGYSLAI
jgi:hypothetical protein